MSEILYDCNNTIAASPYSHDDIPLYAVDNIARWSLASGALSDRKLRLESYRGEATEAKLYPSGLRAAYVGLHKVTSGGQVDFAEVSQKVREKNVHEAKTSLGICCCASLRTSTQSKR